jgi:hypothetical protein
LCQSAISNPKFFENQFRIGKLGIADFHAAALLNPQSTITNPQSAFHNPQSAIRIPQSAILNPQFL